MNHSNPRCDVERRIAIALLFAASAARAQISVPAERVTGAMLAGGAPLTWGPITAITGQGRSCGSAYPDDRGRFTIEIPARAPDCVRQRNTDPPLTFVFVLAGETVGIMTETEASLESPEALGRTRRMDLRWTPIPGFDAGGAPHGGEILAVRYWGQLKLAGSWAPKGTTIELGRAGTATAGSNGVSYQSCGKGTVEGDAGGYWLDVHVAAGCVRDVITSPPLTFIFIVNGERVGTTQEADATTSVLTSLGRKRFVNLRGVSPP
jgi:hypothetical protein